MIFVILGTQDKTFNRLTDKIIELMLNHTINQQVIIQAGSTKVNVPDELKNRLQVYSFISMDEFEKYIKTADLMITHGGVGTIMNGLNANKTIIAVARLAKYHEHENDHQLQIIDTFSKQGYLLGCHDVSQLDDCLKQLDTFKPKPYVSKKSDLLADIATKLGI